MARKKQKIQAAPGYSEADKSFISSEMKRLRGVLGLKQLDVAYKLGLNLNAVVDLEKRCVMPKDYDQVRKIVNFVITEKLP